MPRKKNPVTDLPVMTESQPQSEPLSETPQSNVIPIGTNTPQQTDSTANEASGRDWSNIDSVLSEVVSFI